MSTHGSGYLRQRTARRDERERELPQMLRGLSKLRNLGQGYVNSVNQCR